MTNIIIIGANGFVGRKTLEFFYGKSDYNVTGLSFHEDILPGNSYRFIEADICDSNKIRQVFQEVSPDIVINCSAISVPDYCQTHREEAFNCNAKAVENIALLCNYFNSRLIHLSTDFVFNGQTDRLYKEDDLPDPVNYYGYTKYLSEQYVAQICNNFAIARVIVVYGKSYIGQHGNIFSLVAQRLTAGEKIVTVNDQWRTPTYIGDIVKGIELLSSCNNTGIYHIGGKECLTVSEIAYKVAGFLGLDKSLILPVSTIEMQEKTPRPRFSGLCIDKAKSELGYNPVSIEEGMKLMFY
jgi:dTDP-4-dehydrorhamnose reductase